MEPRSPPPLWPVSNAFSTPWTPHPVDGPARRATTSVPSRRKGEVLGPPPPLVGASTPAARSRKRSTNRPLPVRFTRSRASPDSPSSHRNLTYIGKPYGNRKRDRSEEHTSELQSLR